MEDLLAVLTCILVHVTVTESKVCRKISPYKTTTLNCRNDCCGELYETRCCPDPPGTTNIVAIIAGISIAALFVLILIVGIIVYLCKKKTRPITVTSPGDTYAVPPPMHMSETYAYSNGRPSESPYQPPPYTPQNGHY